MSKLSKKEARILYKEIRSSIKNKEDKDAIIFEKFADFEFVHKYRKIAIYNSFGSEVDTQIIIRYFKSKKCEVFFPRVIENNDLKFIKVNDDTIFEKNKFGILEPKDSSNIIKPDEIEMIVVPGLAYNKDKQRLGYGGGYYDRYLSKCVNALKVGLFYKEQFDYQNSIEFNKNDISLDLIITD